MQRIWGFSIILVILLVLLSKTIEAGVIKLNSDPSISVLEHSSIYFDQKHLDHKVVIPKIRFTPYTKHYINTSISQDTIWVCFTLQNETPAAIEKVLVLTSPLLEHITLYKEDGQEITKGHAHITEAHQTIFPHFHLHLPPNSRLIYYLKVRSDYTPLDFSIMLQDQQMFYRSDRQQQLVTILLLGVILTLMLYSFILSLFIKEKSYLYYSLYLFALLYQQITYVGLTQIFFPPWFVTLDMKISIMKVTFLIITSALFAMHFLKIEWNTRLHRIYRFFIFVSLFEMIVWGLSSGPVMYLIILTGTLFIFFNLFAAIQTYRHGYKESRLFVLGFGIVFVSYAMIISDALGFSSIMQDFQNILMWGTAAEALILSLAFADRYLILQHAKLQSDTKLLEESKKREEIIGLEVKNKTEALNKALQNKDTLLQEVHHRVKNNLQIILAMIRLQNNDIEDPYTKRTFEELENRINAIAKTYSMLIENNDLENVDMEEYISILVTDLQYSLPHALHYNTSNIRIDTDIDVILPLRQAVYIGIIINELITNSYKHAFSKEDSGEITIILKQHHEYYQLDYLDNGKGFDASLSHNSLGLKLIKSLISNQLDGKLILTSNAHTHYLIRFTL
ncbi:MAG: hypothetical protein IE918_09575 [Campylobacterales bacterium]|nr:hypothetical protein [Campylobacterales bacterium]